MSDSRIPQAMAEVAAALDAVRTAGLTIRELLNEDPALGFGVQAYLRKAETQLNRTVSPILLAGRELKDADRIENRRVS